MKKIWKIALSAILALGTLFGLTACRDMEDCIPETLGQAEGLYLYYNNYRSLTDGTQTETLLSEITVDGVTYTREEFTIDCLEYVTATKEIVYSLLYTTEEGEEKYCIWHYNYDTKESGLVMHSTSHAYITVSDSYVFIKFGSGYFPQGVLLDSHLNIIEDSFQGIYILHGDCLYKEPYYNYGKFTWWKDGNFYEIETQKKEISSSEYYITGDYAYVFYDNILYLINLNTGESKTHTFPEGEILKEWHGFYQNGDTLYCITTSQITETDLKYFPLETGCKLYRMQGEEISLVYEFKKSYQMEFDGCNERYLNFAIEEYHSNFFGDKNEKSHGYYDLEKNKFVKGKTKKIEQATENFKIGEYEFYTDSVKYGALMGHSYCYYLHRITNGKDEILQYFFAEDRYALNPVLFDDIHTN